MSRLRNAYVQIPAGLYGVVAVAVLASSLSANPLLSIAALISLVAFVKLLWRPGEPPVLAFAVCFQWIQVCSKIFHANVQGVPIEHLSEFLSVRQATWLSLLGLWVLVLGIRLMLSRLPVLDVDRIRSEAERFSITRVIVFYIVVTLLLSGVGAFAGGLGGLRQIVLAAAGVKWVAYFLMAFVILIRKERFAVLALATAFEVVQGIGFFSGFKTVLFVLIIVIVTAQVRIRASNMAWLSMLAVVLLIMGLAWTAVKPAYRAFLNQGDGVQAVRVSNEDKVGRLVDMLFALDFEDLMDATDPLFSRLAYVDYFAATMDYVPVVHPHENGAVWGQSVQHILQPRILFPDKPVLPSDSELTMKYTGLHLASDAQGTSISIGYMGESYIDFGVPGMYVPVFLLGLLWGGFYVYFIRRNRHLVYGFAFATTALLDAYQFEMASIKVLGGSVMRFIVLALIFKYAVTYIDNWLTRTDMRRTYLPEARPVNLSHQRSM